MSGLNCERRGVWRPRPCPDRHRTAQTLLARQRAPSPWPLAKRGPRERPPTEAFFPGRPFETVSTRFGFPNARFGLSASPQKFRLSPVLTDENMPGSFAREKLRSMRREILFPKKASRVELV